jgi:hypothetical protein
VNVAYRLMTAREVFGAEIMEELRRCGKDTSDPFWREYLPAPLHFMTFLAYARRKQMEAEEIERIRREAERKW